MASGGPRPNSGRKKGTKNKAIHNIINCALNRALKKRGEKPNSKNCSALWDAATDIAVDPDHPSRDRMIKMLIDKIAPNLKTVEATVDHRGEIITAIKRVIIDPKKQPEIDK